MPNARISSAALLRPAACDCYEAVLNVAYLVMCKTISNRYKFLGLPGTNFSRPPSGYQVEPSAWKNMAVFPFRAIV